MSNNTDDQARASLQALVAHVSVSEGSVEPITYSELAKRIGRLNKHGQGHGHGMGDVLSKMGYLLQSVEDSWGTPIPQMQSLVVNKAGPLRGLPDEGIREFWKSYPNLSKQEKANKAQVEYEKILEFGSRWNQILTLLDIPQIQTRPGGLGDKEGGVFGGGGESEQHLDLKNFVAANPKLVGAHSSDEAFTEYALPSLDTIDVLFKGNDRWIGVEVKSRVSDHLKSDYERGLYQVVKYRAILQAMHEDDQYEVPAQVEVVLLLESSLPKQYRKLSETLDAPVIEQIKIDRPGRTYT